MSEEVELTHRQKLSREEQVSSTLGEQAKLFYIIVGCYSTEDGARLMLDKVKSAGFLEASISYE